MNEFGPPGENEALKEAVTGRVVAEGGITFHDFMAMALYEPGLGYYCSPRPTMGREGDYLTSPEASPLFGAMLGRQLREMWQALGEPGRFDVVEAGAGTGVLCRDIVRWTRRVPGGFAAALRYTIVEASPPLRAHQQERLTAEGLTDAISWADGLPQGVAGCILSNELLDAMPVHLVTLIAGDLQEIYVTWDGRAFGEDLRPPSTPAINAYFERLGLLPGERCRAEVNLHAPAWMAQAARALKRGFLLTFDYGYEAPELYAPWRKGGTLLCFYRHNPSSDPYARIGRQDMTSHVDFTSVRSAGEEAGLRTLGFLTQSEFLMNLGLPDALPPIAEGETDLEAFYARRRAVVELVDPAGLGRIKVLAQAAGLDSARLSGLRGPGDG